MNLTADRVKVAESSALPEPPGAAWLTPTERLKREITQLMRDFSVEMTPAEVAKLTTVPPQLPAGSRVYLPWVPGNRFEQTLQAAVRLRQHGMTPVPHLAARVIPDAATLNAMSGALRVEAGVDQVLLVAGSRPVPAGNFDNSLQVLESGLFQRHGFAELALAAHPEGSPDISAGALAEALQRKNAFALAHASDFKTRLVTQFCFDANTTVVWERRARAEGNCLPVHVGLAGLATLATLLKYGRTCGVGASMNLLRAQASGQGLRQSLRLLRMATHLEPGAIVVAAAKARLNDPNCQFERFHFFPFGSLAATVAWAAAVARGDFTLEENDRGLTVA